MVKIMKFPKNGQNDHFWSLNGQMRGHARDTQDLKHTWKAGKIPLVWRWGVVFWGFCNFWGLWPGFRPKNHDFWRFSAIFRHFRVWISAGWCIIVHGGDPNSNHKSSNLFAEIFQLDFIHFWHVLKFKIRATCNFWRLLAGARLFLLSLKELCNVHHLMAFF